MPKFTLSQLDAKPTSYSILDTDLLMLTIGTNTPFLSSVKVSTKQFGDYLSTDTSGWSDDGTVVRLATSTDKVGLGTDSPAEQLTLTGNMSANGHVYMGDRSAPGTPAGGGVLYVEAGALKYKGSNGTVTTLGNA